MIEIDKAEEKVGESLKVELEGGYSGVVGEMRGCDGRKDEREECGSHVGGRRSEGRRIKGRREVSKARDLKGVAIRE